MPRFSFENKFTLGNAIQVAILLLGGMWAYFTLVDDTAQATTDIGSLKPAVEALRDTNATFNTRLTVVESRAETQAVKMQEMAKAIEALTASVQSLSVTAATTKTDVGYVRDFIEELKRDSREFLGN
jgi:methyl-accepting chemotaxis protein